MNSRRIISSVIDSRSVCKSLTCVHTLTSESQEVMLGLNVPTTDLAPEAGVPARSRISNTAIPHSGQLNITNSTLFTPTELDVSVKTAVIPCWSELRICNVSS